VGVGVCVLISVKSFVVRLNFTLGKILYRRTT